ncbi:MAG TPA: hypothetical protein VGL57_15120 [Solirubrobacteraceae bacterium]
MTDASDAGEAGSNEVEPEPRAKLGEEVAAQMDAIEADFGDDYKIGNIVTVVEVIRPEGASLRVRCNQQPWIGVGMLRLAERSLEGQGQGGD